ncbi:hypothetical protein PtrSN002B_006268 [Pyrenophora tritici-repentis]|uniref:Uncharacterized protein n=2 Tax=Pyrenophora tritici-repentis TaxID=45151 RepID=A0A2W1CQX8_9PLEO|nr:uncharacterized protein PTRG_07480 [Pyrenophora tritici-repentis Pt-1C-BFP]KAA8615068.1 hypothetical protein PtrV1_12098 [Pyrenophora tritici-repentis]EDU50399.1 predicted protein [Pyrenophora tritici-repentis Pt-1C-BFP]KAF7444892.1 hypothetical protein A1F99_114450 [Pyrenophora tritici-repentis]KAF7564438.1 hypothetical protein PtrM4_038720 [Pyrenophora tritici-repentis]KAG9379130.1 hypothetical protein A1F94_010899 [Pyrenophora tritici-repentis]
MASTSIAPDTTTFMDQRQYPLFSTPRELRDHIYEYYTYDEEGLAYDYASRTLKYADSRELEFAYTCKLVADEMRGVHLRTNVITFTPSCAQSKEETELGLRPRAARFEHLLHSTRLTQMAMLHHAIECVTEDDIEKVEQAYPSISSAFWSSLGAIRNGYELRNLDSHSRSMSRDLFIASFCDAVQYTLDLVSAHPRFKELVSKACELAEPHPWGRPPFKKGSHRQVLAWRPHLWQIPSLDELSCMEDAYVDPYYTETSLRRYLISTRELGDGGVRYYFSATAICIATLDRLPSSVRKQLRSIVLQEDCRSVGNPEVHAEGLVPYYTETPNMRIHMQTGLHTMLAPTFWTNARAESPSPDVVTCGNLHHYIRILIDWLLRTFTLSSHGMPAGSFVATLDIRSKEAASTWEYLERAAGARVFFPQADSDMVGMNRADAIPGLSQMFGWIGRLPVGNSSVIVDIKNKTSVIQLDAAADQQPQYDAGPASPHSLWTIWDWLDIYRPASFIRTVFYPADSNAYFKTYLDDRIRRKLWSEVL